MERESFENAGHRRPDERAVRQHQGRPRGAARPRQPLHGRRPGDDRPRRLADVGLPHPRPRAVLRRDLLPADRLPRDARLPPRPPERRAGLEGAARRDRHRRGRHAGAAPASGEIPAPRPGRALARHAARRRRRALARAFEPVHGGFGSAPKFPHPMDLRVLLRHHARTGDAHALHMVHPHPRQDGPGRDLRPPRRRLRPLLDRRALARPPLREDALRQRPAEHRLPRSLPGHQRPRVRPGRPRDDRLHPGPDDRPEGPFYCDRGRRQRGRRGEVLRLDPGRGRPRSSAPSAAEEFASGLRPDRARQLGTRHDPQPRPAPSPSPPRLLGRDEAELRARPRRPTGRGSSRPASGGSRRARIRRS